jgi:tetratricopeptide (TPR) repeat protein
MAYVLNNYGELFEESGNLDSAFYYRMKAKDLKMRHGDAFDKAEANNVIAGIYLKSEKPNESLAYAYKALSFLDTNIVSRPIIVSYYLLTEAYNKLKDYKNELRYYKKYKAMEDSSDVQGQKNEQNRKEMKLEFDRIHLSDSIRAVEEIKVKDAKISEKRYQSFFLFSVLLLTIVALSLIYSRFQFTKKQKLIIELKNKEITDSINYAKKIQQSIMPNDKFMEKEMARLKKRKDH